MGFLDRLFGKKPADPNAPFMEHPTGDFNSAVDAMADAIKRLRALPEWNDWITFCAQGAGHDEDSDHLAEIRMRRDELELRVLVDEVPDQPRAGDAIHPDTLARHPFHGAGYPPPATESTIFPVCASLSM